MPGGEERGQVVVRSLEAELGDRLKAIYRLKSEIAQGERAMAARLLVLVDGLDGELLDRIVPIATGAKEARIALRLDTVDNLLRGADAFPAFTLELIEGRTLEAGTEVLEELTVDKAGLRLRVEQGLRSMHRRLVKVYLEDPPRNRLGKELRRATRKLVFLLSGALLAADREVPEPRTPDLLVEALARELEVEADTESWRALLAFARGDLDLAGDGLKQLCCSLLTSLTSVIEVVDRMAPPATSA